MISTSSISAPKFGDAAKPQIAVALSVSISLGMSGITRLQAAPIEQPPSRQTE
jgi:hypothetical protein